MPSLWYIGTLAVAALVPLVQCSPHCTTSYFTSAGPGNSTTTVTYTTYKSTVTKTTATESPVTTTTYSKTVSKTITSTSTFTFYVTSAPTTTTVPTYAGFTPFASVKPTYANGTVANKRSLAEREARNGVLAAPNRRRAASSVSTASSASTHVTTYATQVSCSTTKTFSKTTTSTDYAPTVTQSGKGTQTITVDSGKTTVKTSTTTVHTSVATVYAACQGKANLATAWRGHVIDVWANNELVTIGGSGYPSGADVDRIQQGNQSPTDCCNAAFAYTDDYGYTPFGFAFSHPSGQTQGQCTLLGPNPAYSGGFIDFWSGAPPSGPIHMGLVDPDDVYFCGPCSQPFNQCNCYS